MTTIAFILALSFGTFFVLVNLWLLRTRPADHEEIDRLLAGLQCRRVSAKRGMLRAWDPKVSRWSRVFVVAGEGSDGRQVRLRVAIDPSCRTGAIILSAR
jgi:hypothetical protein